MNNFWSITSPSRLELLKALLSTVIMGVALACLAAGPAVAASATDGSLSEAAKQEFPEMSLYQAASGGIGMEQYSATLLESGGIEMTLAVFIKQADGSFRLLANSGQWVAGGRAIWTVRFEKRSIILSVDSSGGCCSRSGYAFQFLKSGDKFILAGVEEWTYGMKMKDDYSSQYYEARTSANFLTHNVVHSRRSGKAAESEEWGFSGKTEYAEKKLPFRSTVAWEIQNFDADKYYDFVLETANLCGGIGRNMKYEKYSICQK